MDGKIVIFTTGGTIAMRYDPQTGGDVPAVGGHELIRAVPELQTLGEVEVREFANIPSPHMTPALMLDLAKQVETALSEPDVHGVVVTHGTDTLEETAYFLDVYIDSEKPVCFTAAMRGAGDLSSDGPLNIFCASRVAAAQEARGKGVLVVMNEEIHAARDVTKTHTSRCNTFASPFWGPLGYVDADRLVFHRLSPASQKIRPRNIEEDVHLVTLAAGSDAFLLDCLITKKAAGIVVAGFGRGNVTPAAFHAMERAMAADIPVVITSRCEGGRVLDVYAYEGGVAGQKQAGVILGGEISGQKARIKLILALGVTRDRERLAGYFERP